MSNNNTVKPGNIAANIGKLIQDKDTPKRPEKNDTPLKPALAPKKEEPRVEPKKEESIIFNGFKHNLPTDIKSDVFLPITNVSIRLSPIVFGEEVNMAQTAIKEEDLFMETLKLLYNHLVEGPELITKSFDSFLSNIAELDYNAMLYGLYLISYGPEVEIGDTVKCADCGFEKKVDKINLIDLYVEKPFEGKEYEAIKTEKELDLTDCGLEGVKFFFKFPTLERPTKSKSASKSNFMSEIAKTPILNYMSKFIYSGKEYSDKASMEKAVDTLNVKARRKIRKFLEKEFFDYGIKFKYKWTCKNRVIDEDAINESKQPCEKENQTLYNINDLFFRQISESIS